MKNIEKLSLGNFVKINGKLSKVYKLEPGLVNGVDISRVEGIPISISRLNYILGLKFENSGMIWTSEDGKITIQQTSYRADNAWWFHVDNDCFDTLGAADVIFIHELQNFLNSLKNDE